MPDGPSRPDKCHIRLRYDILRRPQSRNSNFALAPNGQQPAKWTFNKESRSRLSLLEKPTTKIQPNIQIPRLKSGVGLWDIEEQDGKGLFFQTPDPLRV